MTSFKISNDDLAVRALQENNKTPVISGAVMPVKASSPVQKSPENIALQTVQNERRNNEINQPQRRQQDRRKMNSSTLLETRSLHDRRTKLARSADVEKNGVITRLRGIDEIV